MRPEPLADRPFHGTIHAERLYTIHLETSDHGIPVLAAALRETEHISVNRDRLERMGLAPGAWLRDLKGAARRCESGDPEIRADTTDGAGKTFRRGDLADEILLRTGPHVGGSIAAPDPSPPTPPPARARWRIAVSAGGSARRPRSGRPGPPRCRAG